MAKSKLSNEERQALFAKIAISFEDRDRGYAFEIQHYINSILESGEDFTPIEVLSIAQIAMEFAAGINATLKPFQHSCDWMEYATRLVAVMLNAAKVARQHAIDAGVDIDDSEQVRDLRESVEANGEDNPNWVENTSKHKH